MGEFRVHHIKFFEYNPAAINCLSYDDSIQKLALSRSNGTVEIWSVSDNWYQEKILPPLEGRSVETIVWCKGRLFSAGLHGDILEHCLESLTVKHSISANGGAVWNLALNASKTILAAATEEGCVVLFKVETAGLEYFKTLDKQEGRILSLAWHEPENVIVTGGLDNIRIWSVKSGHAIQRLTPGRQERNRETIVWAVAIANDFTIVSGDSRGKVCFWNGRQGTQIKSFQVNKADVLCLCVDAGGSTVFAGGVDPLVAQFEYVPVKTDSDWKQWVTGRMWSQHTHDVRAVALCGHNKIVSAGVDCQLIVNQTDGTKKGCKKISPIPQESLVDVAKSAELVLLRYSDHLDVWKLGHTTAHAEQSGEVLPLTRGASKLVQLSSKSEEYVMCAAISDNGQWIAYSDTNKLKLFHLSLDDGIPHLQKVKWMPPELLPARRMTFTLNGTKLLLVSCTGVLQVLKVDALQPAIVHVFENQQLDNVGVHLLSVSDCGQYVATGDHSSNVHVYDLHNLKHLCSLPKRSRQPTAMGFHPSEPVIAVVYADRQLFEYNIEEQEYTEWSRALNKNYHSQWLKRHSKFTQLLYNPRKSSQFLLRDEKMICIIDKTEPFPDSSVNLFAADKPSLRDDNRTKRHCFHICTKYKYLLHIDMLRDDFLTVVERSPATIEEELPPTLKLKKFGT